MLDAGRFYSRDLLSLEFHAVLAVVLAHGAQLTLSEVGSPFLPRDARFARLVQPLLLSDVREPLLGYGSCLRVCKCGLALPEQAIVVGVEVVELGDRDRFASRLVRAFHQHECLNRRGGRTASQAAPPKGKLTN